MTIGAQTLDAFLESLGARTPTPGGGAVAGATAAIGAALGRMVVSYSEGKPALAEHAALHTEAAAALAAFERRAVALADDDAAAYRALSELRRLDEDDDRRRREYPPALDRAIDVPLAVMTEGAAALALLESLRGRTNTWLFSDLAIAAILVEAAVRAAAWNVRINLPQLASAEQAAEYEATVTETLAEAAQRAERITGG